VTRPAPAEWSGGEFDLPFPHGTPLLFGGRLQAGWRDASFLSSPNVRTIKARHVVVASRQIAIGAGATGIAAACDPRRIMIGFPVRDATEVHPNGRCSRPGCKQLFTQALTQKRSPEMTDNTQSSESTVTFEGFVKFAAGEVISIQCFEGRCRECPDEAPFGEAGEGVLNGLDCEHGCGHGPAAERPADPRTDTAAVDVIAEWLRDPEWGSGMLEDIADAVRATGRTVENYPDERQTWKRH
jgi:hypothetical protein